MPTQYVVYEHRWFYACTCTKRHCALMQITEEPEPATEHALPYHVSARFVTGMCMIQLWLSLPSLWLENVFRDAKVEFLSNLPICWLLAHCSTCRYWQVQRVGQPRGLWGMWSATRLVLGMSSCTSRMSSSWRPDDKVWPFSIYDIYTVG